MSKKKLNKAWIIAGIGATFIVILLVAPCFLGGGHKRDTRSDLETARTWARLDPLPATATNLSVNTQGGMFSREFVITFTAPMKDIDKWLASSPGTAGVAPTRTGSERIYKIKAGGGAQFAQVKVDESNGRVEIYTYWS